MSNAPPDTALTSIAKYEYTDEAGICHGIANPHFIKTHNIVCVGQFIKQLLEDPESDDWSGWIGIKNGNSEFGNPRVYYVGSAKEKGKDIIGTVVNIIDYNKDWLETNLVRRMFKSITYTDNYGKIDWLIELDDKYVQRLDS